MPVTGLCFIQENHPNFGQTLIDRLFKLHQVPHRPIERYCLEYRLYRSTPYPTSSSQPPQPTKQMQQLEFIVNNNKRPWTYCLIDGAIVVVDADFKDIVKGKLGALWGLQQALRAEGVGYDMGDWRFRALTLSQQGASKGVIVEIEYFPTSHLPTGAPIIREIMRPIIKDSMKQLRIAEEKAKYYGDPPAGMDPNTEELFTNLDTGKQYMELLRMRREDGRPL